MSSRFFRRHYFLPTEHGAWIWLLGPFVLGAVAGGSFTPNLLMLLVAGLSAFLLRQPLTIVAKVYAGRRHRRQLRPAALWAGFYCLLGLLSLLPLILGSHTQLLLLPLPGVPVFMWHLWLLRQREKRGQPGVEIIAAGVLSLAAPAAYWVAEGASPSLPWLLWALSWFQSAASIVNVHLRLHQRELAQTPGLRARLGLGTRSLLYHFFNMAGSVALAEIFALPAQVPIAYALAAGDAVAGALRPAVGARPAQIGFRQLAVSSAFFGLLAWGFAG